ncbi:hypothetical protein ACKLNO_05510 [Neisseriaceae bacterium B1]
MIHQILPIFRMQTRKHQTRQQGLSPIPKNISLNTAKANNIGKKRDTSSSCESGD